MAGPEGRAGGRKKRDRPPPMIFLGLGGLMLLLNHLSVVLGAGLQPEALMMGVWLVLMGGWVLVAGRTFDAIWAWTEPSGRRTIGFFLFTFAVAFAVADAVAWLGYGCHLLG